jgi:hypothetical protein
MTEPLHTIGGEPLIPGVDLAGLALRALGFGAALGSAAECVVLWATRMLTAHQAPTDTPDAGALFWVVILGTLASMGVGGGTVWSLLAPVGSPWRRAGLSAIAGFATLVAAALAVPVDANFGPQALLALALVFGLLALRAGMLVRRWPSEQHPA